VLGVGSKDQATGNMSDPLRFCAADRRKVSAG
jgi:hypothetical protein